MRTLLALVLVASLLAGLAGGPGVSQAADSQAAVASQAGGHSGGPMTAMDCGACWAMGACIASPPAQHAGPAASGLPLRQPSHEISGRICAPETAPPRPSSL